MISNNERGFSIHCFKCGYNNFIPHEDQRLIARKRRREATEALRKEKAKRSRALPSDFSHTIAPAGLAWLGSGGWTLSMIKQYGVGWSEAMRRVILPVYQCHEYIGYTARAVDKDHAPKYWENLPANSLWWSKESPAMERSPLVVTEDILSAGKVGRVVPAVALLGTTVLNNTIAMMVAGAPELLLWLDSDDAGSKCMNKFKYVLDWYTNVRYRVVQTDWDPKHLSLEEIQACVV